MADLSTKVIKYLEANGKTADELGPDFENPNVAITDNGTGPIIKIWNAEKLGIAKPTDEQLNALESEADILESNNKVIQTRTKLYGTTTEQLEYIVENGVDAFVTKQNKIKTDNPKG